MHLVVSFLSLLLISLLVTCKWIPRFMVVLQNPHQIDDDLTWDFLYDIADLPEVGAKPSRDA